VNLLITKKLKIKKESFHKEWESTFSISEEISDQINDYRPVWISEDTQKFWQTDQFHMHIIKNINKIILILLRIITVPIVKTHKQY
jgi:hypothetical protein